MMKGYAMTKEEFLELFVKCIHEGNIEITNNSIVVTDDNGKTLLDRDISAIDEIDY